MGSIKKRYFKLSPSLGDGTYWTITESTKIVLDFIKSWCEEFKDEPGEGFAIKVIEMTEKELEAIPEL